MFANFSIILLRSVTVTLLSVGCSIVAAQDVGSLLREQQRQQELQKQEGLHKLEESPAKPLPAAPAATHDSIFVKKLRFTGKVDLLLPLDRERISSAIRDKNVSLSVLLALAEETTIKLQQRGHLLAHVILPPQDVTSGFITLEIVEGTLERIDFGLSEETRIQEDLLRSISQRQIKDDSLTKQSLEEVLLRMNALPGVTANARLTPGTLPNSSRLVIHVKEAPAFSASIDGNNFGSPDIGRTQANALVTLSDLTGWADRTRFTMMVTKGQQLGQIETSAPWGASGFTARANYSYLIYRNIEELGQAAKLQGFAHFVETGLNYDVIRSRRLNLQLSAGIRWKALIDDSVSGRLQDKRAWSRNIGVSGDVRDALGGGAVTSWSLDWTSGNLDLSRIPAALAADAASLRTQGNYQRVSAGAGRLQSLPGNFSLFTHFYGQWAGKNLDSSEEFALGGPYGVRGWPVGAGRGDMGVLGTVELRHDRPAPLLGGQMQLSAFLDGGRVRVNANPNGLPLLTACGCNTYGLASIGLGMLWAGKDQTISALYARGLGNNPGRSDANGGDADTIHRQFWLQSSIRF